MTGTLYLCATPIGNLKDITQRVLETLRTVDLIAAEDTRTSAKLLAHFDIHTPTTAYHEYNRYEKAQVLIQKLLEGTSIALITDAGTPAISDPGEVLVRMCHEAQIPVTSLPGPSACITALALSGLSARRFVFEGFLPPKEDKKERRRILERLQNETRTTIFYVAPHDLKKDVADLYETLGDRKAVFCRELTKKFEEVIVTTLHSSLENMTPRGEYVLVLEGADEKACEEEAKAAWEAIPITAHVARYEQEGYDRKEAMKKVAKERGLGKREVYAQLLQQREE